MALQLEPVTRGTPALTVDARGSPILDPAHAARVGLSVLVPAYNEEPRLERTLRDLRAALESGYDRTFEVIVVDDGSSDRTLEVALAAADRWSKCRVIAYAQNEGKGGALRRGLRSARGDRIAFFDADGDVSGATLLDLLRVMDASPGAGAVVGRRRWRVRRPWHRHLASRLLARYSRLALGIPVPETQAGVKVFGRSDVLRAAARCVETGYLFDLELLAYMQRQGSMLVSVDILLAHARPSRIGILEGLHELAPALRIWRRFLWTPTAAARTVVAAGAVPWPATREESS